MRGFLQRLRAGLDSRYEHELGCLRERHPWLADYDIQAPVRDWYAIHKPTGTTIGPAKNITALDRLIRADPQAARLRQRPVPYPLPDSETDDWEDRTLLDAWDTWPRSTDGTHPPRSAA